MRLRSTMMATAALVWASFLAVARGQSGPVNEQCPVMPERKASPAYRANYRGREIRFCCSACVRKFQEDTASYLRNVPHLIVPENESEWWSWSTFDRWTHHVKDYTERYRFESIYFLVVAGVILVGLKARRSQEPAHRFRRFAIGASSRSNVVILALLGVSVSLSLRWREAEASAARERSALEQEQAKAPDWKKGAELTQWAWPRGFHRLPQGMHPTYYRGNDERSEKLFNGGRYRTATFRLSVVDAEGKAAEAGTKAEGLKLSLQILRAPKTSEHFFSPEVMNGIFLATAQDGTRKITFRTTQPNQAWAAEIPLASADAKGYASIRDLWLLSAGSAEKLRLPNASVHYAIHIHLHARDGKLLPQSCVWMVPVYASPILNDENADAEWFSDEPIPENEGELTDDPELLGVTRTSGGK